MRILIIDDEKVWADKVREAISEMPGASVQHAQTGKEGLKLAGAGGFDVLIIDRMIDSDGADGLEIVAKLRELGVNAPAIILSSLGHARHRVEGLESGADDYLGKPFDADELRARLKALARRAGLVTNPGAYVFGPLEIQVKARTAHWAGQHIPLSPQEFNILAVLAEAGGNPADRQTLWTEVWTDFKNLPPQVNVIDVAMARLRRAITRVSGTDIIETVRGKGWRLARLDAE